MTPFSRTDMASNCIVWMDCDKALAESMRGGGPVLWPWDWWYIDHRDLLADRENHQRESQPTLVRYDTEEIDLVTKIDGEREADCITNERNRIYWEQRNAANT